MPSEISRFRSMRRRTSSGPSCATDVGQPYAAAHGAVQREVESAQVRERGVGHKVVVRCQADLVLGAKSGAAGEERRRRSGDLRASRIAITSGGRFRWWLAPTFGSSSSGGTKSNPQVHVERCGDSFASVHA